MLYTVWYHFYNFKTVKNRHGGVLLLVKLQAWRSVTLSKVAGFRLQSSTPAFHVFKIVRMVPNRAKHHIFAIKQVFQNLKVIKCPEI